MALELMGEEHELVKFDYCDVVWGMGIYCHFVYVLFVHQSDASRSARQKETLAARCGRNVLATGPRPAAKTFHCPQGTEVSAFSAVLI